jgi:hypothetical protein
MFVEWLRVLQKQVDRREPRVADGGSVDFDLSARHPASVPAGRVALISARQIRF